MNNLENGLVESALLGDSGSLNSSSRGIAPRPGARSSSRAPEFRDEISEATDTFGLGATAQPNLIQEKKVKSGPKPA